MKDYLLEYEAWRRALSRIDPAARREMEGLSAERKEAAFAARLEFGTGGLRAELGIGPGRMNRYTVARATKGLAGCILESDAPKSCAVAYDTRHGSLLFAMTAARVLLGAGVEVYLYACPAPTPALSWTVRRLGLGWGVVVTASHNPKQYNGYKVYDHRGVQAVPELAETILAHIERTPFFEAEEAPLQGERLHWLGEGELREYARAMASLSLNREESEARGRELKVVYSALHGAGAFPVPEALRELGFEPVVVQSEPDGDFGGLYMPNPEDPRVYEVALREAEKAQADLLLATDPDGDRVGVQARNPQGGFTPLNGNQIGALLIDFLTEAGVSGGRRVITTIVSGELGQRVARSRGVQVTQVLTGFKYIGDLAERWPKGAFLFGYEESYGYLTGDAARDKDAAAAAILICGLALRLKLRGETLLTRLAALEKAHGVCLERTISRNVPGVGYRQTIEAAMRRFRGLSEAGGLPILRAEDFLSPACMPELPRADVLKWHFAEGWVAVRPSGTEPNIKFYVEAVGKTPENAEIALHRLQNVVDGLLVGE